MIWLLLFWVVFYQPVYWGIMIVITRLNKSTTDIDYLAKIKAWFVAFWNLVNPRAM